MQNLEIGTTVRPKKEFLLWAGWLRIIAMIMVCWCHACDPLSAFGTSDQKFWIEIYGSLVRPCVPLFVMLTGALLLPVEESFGGMFRKRVLRLLPPFLIWTAVYAVLPWLLHNFGVAQDIIQRVFFPFATPLHTDGVSIVRTFFLSLIQFNQYAVQLWYIYLLIGLYLFMPVLSAWLRSAKLRDKWIFIGLWGLSMLSFYWPLALEFLRRTEFGALFFADYITRFSLPETLAASTSFDAYPILGGCDWNTFNMFHVFSGFTGYLVLGNILKDLRLSVGKTLLISLSLFFIGYAVVLFGTHWMWRQPGCTAKMFEFFWWYCSLPVAMMTAAVFLMVRLITKTPAWIIPFLKQFSRVGLAVFCVHYVFVTGCYYLLSDLLPISLLVAFAAFGGFICSWCVATLLYKIPNAKRFFG